MDASTTAPTPTPDAPKTRLVDAKVTTPNEAFNLLITFINLAQKRGAFGLDEAHKIFDCMKLFQNASEELVEDAAK
jgi:hypothetical protein